MSRLPDYKLKVFNKTTGQRGEVGAGWKNEDGSITINLNPCVVLTPDSNIAITLFVNDSPAVRAQERRANYKRGQKDEDSQ